MTTHVTDEHEPVLDYAYDMLSGEDKARFETHLSTCGRCQAELDAMGKVRIVAKAALSLIEPSERFTGALHAQLMHEAGKRRPRGKVVPFVRRVLRHPGYAAAAALLVVGGAVGLQWERGRLFMPARRAEAPVVSAPATAPSPPPPGAAEAPANEMPQLEKTKGGAPVLSPPPVSKLSKSAPAPKAPSRDTDSPSGREEGQAPSQGTASPVMNPSSHGSLAADAKDSSLDRDQSNGYAADKEQESSRIRQPMKRTSTNQLDDLASDERPRKSAAPSDRVEGGVVGGLTGSGGGGSAQKPRMQAVVPEPAPAAVASVAQHHAKQDSAVAPTTTAPSKTMEQPQAPAEAQAAMGDLQTDRRRAQKLAQAGRCDEAVALYESVEQRDELTSQERKSYTSCVQSLTVSRQQQHVRKAKQQQLKAAPVPQNASPSD